ncbi:MAG: MmgE/PrpD family protein, partial [Rhodospirillales bacterium]
RAGAMEAALINGTASHVLDFDDINKSLGGHPSVTLVPVIMALADELGSDGKKFVQAFVAGYEVECKFARAVNFYHYEKGWHPTATIGAFGATAAAAVMLDLTEEQTANALAITASMAAGLKANTGSHTKSLHVGNTCRNGIYAARIAKNGFTGRTHAFEHNQGYLECFNGAGNHDIGKMWAEWANPLDIVSPGVGIKRFPSCASTHGPIDCMLALREQGLRAEDVEAIRITMSPRRIVHTNRPFPKDPLDCKFSVQYTVARALTDGWIAMEHFHGDADKDPTIRRLLGKTTADTWQKDDPELANQLAARVQVTKKDGAMIEHQVDQAVGRGPELPVPPDQLRRKFDDCCAVVLDKAATEKLWTLCERLETLDNARALTDVMDVPVRASVQAAE